MIDSRHRHIAAYINGLHDSVADPDRRIVARLVGDPVDYTLSHLASEVNLMEEARHDPLSIHQKTHEAFLRRIGDFRQWFGDGEDVARPLAGLPQTWLMSDILVDDASCTGLVREKMPGIRPRDGGSRLGSSLRRFSPHWAPRASPSVPAPPGPP